MLLVVASRLTTIVFVENDVLFMSMLVADTVSIADPFPDIKRTTIHDIRNTQKSCMYSNSLLKSIQNIYGRSWNGKMLTCSLFKSVNIVWFFMGLWILKKAISLWHCKMSNVPPHIFLVVYKCCLFALILKIGSWYLPKCDTW